MLKLKNILFVLLFLFTFFTCYQKPKFPLAPTIRFEKIGNQTAFDTLTLAKEDVVTISLFFQDGDGDLGLNQGDTLPPFQEFEDANRTRINPNFTNYKVEVFEVIGSEEIPFVFPDADKLGFNGRFPRLQEEGKANPLEGTLNYRLRFRQNNRNIRPNTLLKFRVRILDRSLNISNEAVTDTVRIKKL